MLNKKITVEVLVCASLESAWKEFTNQDSVIKWNFASDEWCCPKAVNNLRKGGMFNYRMESKDGLMGFDFCGEYTEVKKGEIIKYELGDKREVEILFKAENGKTRVIEIFDLENDNSMELQKNGWQAILNNYKKYVENRSNRESQDGTK